MAIEILKELDPKKIEAWDRLHDKRKLYHCERCGAEWKCEYHENNFGSKHEFNGDPDILCHCCGFPTVQEVELSSADTDRSMGRDEEAAETIGPLDEVKYFECGINTHLFPEMSLRYSKGSLWFEDKKAGELMGINDSVTEFHVVRLVFALETEFNWIQTHRLGEFNFEFKDSPHDNEFQLRLWRKE